MKKIFLPMLVFILASGFAVFGQQPQDSEDFSDETSIIIDDTENAGLEESENGRFFTTWDFVKVILILAAVILIVYAIFYGLKKAGGSKYQSDDLIRLLGSQSLTQSNSIHLIEVGSKYYLVGCGDGSVSHLADIDDKETIDEIILKNPPKPEGKKSFADFLNLKIGRNHQNNADINKKVQNNKKIMHDQAERLKKM